MKHAIRFTVVTAMLLLCTIPVLSQTVTIPVVFHVLYGTTPQNLHDSILQDQLDVLNEDFNTANSDLWKVPTVWQPLIGNMNINFVFASLDPQGNLTTGIERRQHSGSWQNNSLMKSYASGGLDAWPDTSYLNIWVCNLANGLLGFTQLPGGPASTDGIVLHYSVVGRGNYAMSPFDLGRVGTHEMGHWLGLLHMGPDVTCYDVDSIVDTPSFSSIIYGGYAPFTVLTDACQPNAPGIMWMNFMSYVNDSSMVFFTQGQITKMTWVLNNMRQGFFTPDGIATGINSVEVQSAMSVFPSPSNTGMFTLDRNDATSDATIYVYNSTGQLVTEPILLLAGTDLLQLNLSQCAEGVYSIVLRTEAAVETQQIVITK